MWSLSRNKMCQQEGQSVFWHLLLTVYFLLLSVCCSSKAVIHSVKCRNILMKTSRTIYLFNFNARARNRSTLNVVALELFSPSELAIIGLERWNKFNYRTVWNSFCLQSAMHKRDDFYYLENTCKISNWNSFTHFPL